MNTVQAFIEAKKLREDALPLRYKHPGDSGMDVYACAIKRLDENNKPYEVPSDLEAWSIMPGETVLVCTGWAVSIPLGTEIQVRLTSGNGLKTKMRIPNAPGTVDSNYRGEIGVILENTSNNIFMLNKNAKVAQLVLCPVFKAIIKETDELDETDRSSNGYGSTGSMVENKNDVIAQS